MAGITFLSVCKGQTAPPTGSANMASPSPFKSDKDRESYALGMYFGMSVKRTGVDVNLDLMAQGLKDSQSDSSAPLLTQQEMMAAMNQLRQAATLNRQKMQAEEGQKNQMAGAQFLEANKSKPGVVTLPDGLQYKVVTDGNGDMPGPDDVVTVNYRGTLVDGTEFDSSAKTGHPAQFPVRRVIPGWTEALEKMKVGSKWDVYVPSNLAYGSQGRLGIEPNETLIFEVELLSIQHPAPAAQPQPLTSDIIRVPSAEEMKNGAKVETIKSSDLQKMQQSATNQ